MALTLAQIVSTPYEGATSVKVQCAVADGTPIFLYRGELLLGSGVIASQECTIAVAGLYERDVIQASVSQKGNLAGTPVIVQKLPVQVTGWATPTELEVWDADGNRLTMPADQFEELYGFRPAAYYDAEGVGAVVLPEYSPLPQQTIQFGVNIIHQPGQTILEVVDVLFANGAPLIAFNNGPFSNLNTLTVTESTTVQVSVRGEDDTQAVARLLTVDVLAAPSAGPVTNGNPAIMWPSYWLEGSSEVWPLAHSWQPLECNIDGFDETWRAPFFRIHTRQNFVYPGVGPGLYTIQFRVAGDTNPDNWTKVLFNKTW
ncbi:hypothetical protein GCM10023189_43130 [Nibrella saemangeumensis]|uniref:Uncharacterized protein n=1 Tax=Nibrella saemangeumensis TaxID=1084526 RepID=A0ABP8NDT6_9BACT